MTDARPSAGPGPEQIAAWLERSGRAARSLRELEGDVSLRRYFRAELDDGKRAIVAYYPPEIRHSCAKFAETGQLLERRGIRVPAIQTIDCDAGLMLLEDVGGTTLFDLRDRTWERLLPYFRQAVDFIGRIRSIPLAEIAGLNPPLDRHLLWQELQQSWRVLLEPRDLVGGATFATRLHEAFEAMCERLGSAVPVSCHRDFMARNLVPTEASPRLVVLDHQDLRPGPRFYDLASLLNDSLFPPPAFVEALLRDQFASESERLDYHRAAAQRTLKAAGTFEAFARRGVPRHRPLIPPTLDCALRHLRRLPELEEFSGELEDRWRPILTASSSG